MNGSTGSGGNSGNIGARRLTNGRGATPGPQEAVRVATKGPRRRNRLSGGVVRTATGMILGAAAVGASLRVAFRGGNTGDNRMVSSGGYEPVDHILGHRKVDECPPEELVKVTADGREQMRRPAADAFMRMQARAREDNIYLTPISTFRSVQDQQGVFFGIKALRGQRAEDRARVSAPPGYSEHHTGYVVDIGDSKRPEAHLEAELFEATEAYRWLTQNAHKFHFELSFPQGNSAGVDYEPWHWRWVGDEASMRTFYANVKR